MTPDSQLEPQQEILAYIRANRGSYSREAIARELRISGHSDAAIAAAWATIEAGEAPAATPTVPPESAPESPASLTAAAPGVERDPAIERYIHANRATYNRAAVTAALVESGHAPADIEAAWADVLATDAPPTSALPTAARSTRRAVLNSWRFWLTAVLAFIALIAVPSVLSAAYPNQPVGVGIGGALLVGYIAAALIMLGVGKARDVAYGLLWSIGAILALILVFALLAFVLLVIILGICLVALGQSGLNP